MSRKDMARLMRAHGIRAKPRDRTRQKKKEEEPRPKPGRRLVDSFQEVDPEEATKPDSVYRVPDAWDTAGSMKKPLPPEVREAQLDQRKGAKRKADHKRRGRALNFSASEEESYLLRRYAFDQGMSFSEWARIVLFRATGKPIPPRS